MDKQPLYIIIGVLAGVIVGIFISRYAVNTQNYGMMNMMGMGAMMQKGQNSMAGEEDMHGMSMNQMSSTLAALKGEDFDRMFVELMIEHHQGAIDMAELVSTNTDRKELIDLAEDITSAQTKEIEMMKGWLEDWF